MILTSEKKGQSAGTKSPKRGPFPSWKTDRLPVYEHFRVIGAIESVEDYADLFTIGLRKNDIQEFDSKWDGILLSMTKIPPVDILEGLYKSRIRESGKLKTVLEFFDVEIHQEIIGPDYHRLRDGEKKYRAGDTKQEFCGQKRKL